MVARLIDPAIVDLHTGVQNFEALPRPLLVLILILNTSVQDKKALRQTCRLFLETLDSNMTCLALKMARADEGKDTPYVAKLLKRVQHMNSMRAIALMDFKWDSLLQFLPERLTTLRIRGTNIDIQALGRLPNLMSLYVEELGDSITGMEHVTGLSQLHCSKPVGHLAHLAPTLTCLRVQAYEDVPDMTQLTNLQVLAFEEDVSAGFFETFGKLPLTQLGINVPFCNDAFVDPKTWEASPTTLTRLNLGFEPYIAVLPAHITHLQLGFLRFNTVNDIAEVLPDLISLDIYCSAPWAGELFSDETVSFLNISRFTNLQSLGIAVIDSNGDRILQRQQVLSVLPELARAVERGVELNVMEGLEELMDVFNDPWASFAPVQSAWAVNA